MRPEVALFAAAVTFSLAFLIVMHVLRPSSNPSVRLALLAASLLGLSIFVSAG